MYHWLFVVFAVPGGRMRLVERRKGDGSAAVSGGAAADQFSVCTATLAHISTASTTQHHPLYQTLSRLAAVSILGKSAQPGRLAVGWSQSLIYCRRYKQDGEVNWSISGQLAV